MIWRRGSAQRLNPLPGLLRQRTGGQHQQPRLFEQRGKTIKNQRLKEHMHMLERVLAAAVRHRRIACLW
jgi:hypothetical protein